MCLADESVPRGPVGLSALWAISGPTLELVVGSLRTNSNDILLTLECMPAPMAVP